jgi:hypothetical protein
LHGRYSSRLKKTALALAGSGQVLKETALLVRAEGLPANLAFAEGR